MILVIGNARGEIFPILGGFRWHRYVVRIVEAFAHSAFYLCCCYIVLLCILCILQLYSYSDIRLMYMISTRDEVIW